MNGGSLAVGGILEVGVAGSASGALSVTGGSVTTPLLYLGVYNGAGTVTQSGGSVSVSVSCYIGGGVAAGTGTYNISGGTLSSTDIRLGQHDGNFGTINQSGGNVVIGSNIWLGSDGAAVATYTLTAGTATIGNMIVGNNASSTGTVNLEGGLLSVNGLAAGAGTAAFNFGGGTLQAHTADLSVALPMTLTGTGGNATVDTNGHTVTLSGAVSGTASAGGLTKVGDGTLVLNGANSYVGATDIQAGGLTLGGGATFTNAGTASAITMEDGTTLASSTATVNINRDLVLGKTNLVIGYGPNFEPDIGTITVGQLSAIANNDKVIVSIASGTDTVSGSVSLINYSSEGANVPHFVPLVDGIGTVDYSVTDDHVSAVVANVTEQSGNRGFVGSVFPSLDSNWSNNANWQEGVAPNSTASRAWFDDTGVSVATYNVTLDEAVTVSSMLFRGAGFTITAAAGSDTITLDSSIAANTQIQVLSGDHVVNPDIAMAAGDPIITVAGSSSLTLNGVLSDAGTASAALTLVGPGTLTLTNGANSYTGVTTIQSGTLAINAPAPGASRCARPTCFSGRHALLHGRQRHHDPRIYRCRRLQSRPTTISPSKAPSPTQAALSTRWAPGR